MLSIGIMLLVIVVVVVIFLFAMIKFRRKKLGEDYVPKDVEGNHKLELVWTIIPIILLIILAIPTVMLTFSLGDTKAIDKVDEKVKVKNLLLM